MSVLIEGDLAGPPVRLRHEAGRHALRLRDVDHDPKLKPEGAEDRPHADAVEALAGIWAQQLRHVAVSQAGELAEHDVRRAQLRRPQPQRRGQAEIVVRNADDLRGFVHPEAR